MIKQIIFSAIIVLISQSCFSQTYVPGRVKKNGTYKEGHYRTSPNNTTSDNFSTKGNTNPYNGKKGTKRNTDYDAPKPKKSKSTYNY